MSEQDWLDARLREWQAPEPAAEMDERVIAAYRTSVPRPSPSWRRFWTMRVSVPAPALALAALALVTLIFWLRPAPVPAGPPSTPDAVTRLTADGFQPLPNGEARVVAAVEIQRKEVRK
jgi:hypothetical protein